MLRKVFAFLLALKIAVVPARAEPPIENMLSYRLRAGDNLYSLAQRYLVRVSHYRTVQRINHITDPRRLPVGYGLRIPRPLLRYSSLEARIIAFHGHVQVQGRAGVGPASIGARVSEGASIVTAANSFVSLGLPDDSVVTLPSQSSVVVARLRKISLTGAVERRFTIRKGRVRAIVTPQSNSGDDFQVTTPTASMAVRGTEFRVSHEPAQDQSQAEVLDGSVDVRAGHGAIARRLMSGFGTLLSPGGMGEPTPLLPPPSLLRPGSVQEDDLLAFQIDPLKGAEAYHVQVARDAGFIDTVAETVVRDGEEATLPAVPDGTWFVRLGGVDANGLEGLPATYGFQRRLSRIEADVGRHRVGRTREYLFRWRAIGEGFSQFRFQLLGDADGAPVIDLPGLTAHSVVVTDLVPGTYRWRVMSLQKADDKLHEKWSPYQRLVISQDE